MKRSELKAIIKEILTEEVNNAEEKEIELRIRNIIRDEIELRTVKFTDDEEIDPKSIDKAANEIVVMLKLRGLIK